MNGFTRLNRKAARLSRSLFRLISFAVCMPALIATADAQFSSDDGSINHPDCQSGQCRINRNQPQLPNDSYGTSSFQMNSVDRLQFDRDSRFQAVRSNINDDFGVRNRGYHNNPYHNNQNNQSYSGRLDSYSRQQTRFRPISTEADSFDSFPPLANSLFDGRNRRSNRGYGSPADSESQLRFRPDYDQSRFESQFDLGQQRDDHQRRNSRGRRFPGSQRNGLDSWESVPGSVNPYHPEQSGQDRFRNLDDLSRPDRDELVPGAVPTDQRNFDARTANDRLTARYQNPVTIRAVSGMSTSQSFQLFAEVSSRIDARHVEPASYQQRVDRALRNLALGMDNPAFRSAMRISSESFSEDGFRNLLSRTSTDARVNNYNDARSIMNSVATAAEQSRILPAAVVAYEFANASVETLDRFSGLEPEAPRTTPSAGLDDEIVGIGVEVKEHEKGLLLVKPLRGGPAANAGLERGDLIVAINGRSIAGQPLSQAVDQIGGTQGSNVRLTIQRGNSREAEVTLTRSRVQVWSIDDARLVDSRSGVAYLSLNRFAQRSTAELDQALSELHKSGMKSLVLDLRGNPGGLLTTCVEISNRFLPCGTIVSTRGRNPEDNMQETATFARTWDIPLVVLTDGDSASASEILAAAVQENGRGIVVGEKSYGKGSVQTHFPLQSISGNLRLTTAKFFSPAGHAMSGRGVIPDVTVVDSDGLQNGDDVLTRAVQIAASSQLREMAAAAATQCRTGSSPQLQPRRSGDLPIYDSIDARIVLR